MNVDLQPEHYRRLKFLRHELATARLFDMSQKGTVQHEEVLADNRTVL